MCVLPSCTQHKKVTTIHATHITHTTHTTHTYTTHQDPTEVIDKYGADALRLYLINRCVLDLF